jgi:pimeloyl-ACP methyl ester carboxylesterase
LKAKNMNIPDWLKPGTYGAVCGAIALAVVGFSWGGWVTASTARQRAEEQAKAEVIAALVPICLEQSKKDPQLADRVAILKAASSWSRGDLVLKNGWATMPGTTAGDGWVAGACAEKLGL